MLSGDAPPDNVLGATNLSNIIATILPSTTPQIKNAFDAIALGAHASFLAVGFRLIGLSEEVRLPESSTGGPSPLPESWNANAGHYSFRYKHAQSSMEYLLQINRMGSKAVILAMGLGDDKTTTFDIPVQDFTSDGNLPASPTVNTTDQLEIRRNIASVFINVGRLSDLGSMVRIKVIQKLIPGLTKSGYAETSETSASSSRNADRDGDYTPPRHPDQHPFGDRREPGRPYMPLQDPLAHPRRPMPDPMPGFEDEHEILRPQRGGFGGMRGPSIGERDLYPAGLGPNDPFRPMGPGLGGTGGGMHPSFDDPLFTGQGQGGGRGFDPRAPPGSRYDPTGPFGGHPRGSGMDGRPSNPFGGFGDGDFL